MGWLHPERASQPVSLYELLAAPAIFSASADVMLSTPSTGLSVTSATPASRKSSPARLRLLSAVGVNDLLDRFYAICAIFTGTAGSGAKGAILTIAMPGLQPPSTDTHCVLDARCLQRLNGTRRGGSLMV